MKTYLDCIPCFFKQTLAAARLAGAGENAQKKIMDEVSRLFPGFPLDASPPEMGRKIYEVIRKITGKTDPFRELKEKNNRFALKLYPRLKNQVENSDDRLRTAVEIAIAGNIIDYGVKTSLNIDEEIEKCLGKNSGDCPGGVFSFSDYQEFEEALAGASTVLYLADNAGEVVFDRVLLEELHRLAAGDSAERKIFYAVRGGPVINDALIEDAQMCGIDKLAVIISSGVDVPGTILSLCSEKFLEIYESADVVISKGQGNFETLDGEDKLIFFLLKVKCPVIARNLKREIGDVILKRNENYANL